jgi:hypothetical protein
MGDAVAHTLTAARVDVKSGALAYELAIPERARIDSDANAPSRCASGQFVIAGTGPGNLILGKPPELWERHHAVGAHRGAVLARDSPSGGNTEIIR